jgi:CO/xanthine dehydrogenase Mo-binding subunit
MKEFNFIGKSVPRLDAVEKVTGKAKYTSDFKMTGLLYSKVLRSTYAHAKIRSIDISKAQVLPGVRAVITPKDAPSEPISPLLGDQYVLCKDNIARCVGDPVAAVAADTIEIAEEAVELIKVDYEELPAVFDVEEAFQNNPSVVVHPNLFSYRPLTGIPVRPDLRRPNVCQTYKIRSGDIEKGFEDADLIIENRYTTARMQHAQIEPHVADAWFEADGGLTVRSSCQLPHLLRVWLSRIFHLPTSKVRILTALIGGGFGGKGGIRAEPIAALLAQRSSRPVRLTYSREEMFVFGGQRMPYVIDIKDGVKNDGTLIAREMRVLLGIGAYSDFGALLVRRAAVGAVGTYRIPNFKLDSFGVYMNLPLTGALRGFGCPEVQWPIEQQMDIISEKLGIDAVEIRNKNILNEGDRDVSGMVTRPTGMRECLEKVAEWIGWRKKYTEDNTPWRKGKGIAIGSKSVAAGYGMTSVVNVKVWHDGIVEVQHSAAQMGQGIKTALAQIAAEEFEIPIERVRLISGDTAFCPFDFGTVASRSLICNGNALIAACVDAKEQLYKLASLVLNTTPEDLAISNGKIFSKTTPDKSIGVGELFTPLGIPRGGKEIIGTGSYTSPYQPEDSETGQSERPVFDYSYTANAVEVAVNVETGEIIVLKNGMACDIGKAINPKLVEGQIEGGIGMGMGSALYEEVIMDKGLMFNASFCDYYLPTTLEMPRGENSAAILVEILEPEGPFGAKGVGELSIIAAAPAIANAVYDAIGIRIMDMPLSKEKMFKAIRRL